MSLKTKPVRTESYALEVLPRIDAIQVRLSGTFDMAAAVDLSVFLTSLEGEVKRLRFREIVVDVVEVYYLGSSCIKSFVSLTEAMKKLDFHPLTRVVINPRLDWHERTFSILARLAPSHVTIEKAK